MENITPTPEVSPAPQESGKKFRLPKTINIRTLILVLVVIAIIGLAFYFKNWFIAATVDGKPITRLEVIKELEKQSGRQVLDSLINEKLIDNEAAKKNITVSQQEKDDKIKSLEDQFTAQGGTLDSVLEAQGMTREELQKQITLQVKAEKILADKIAVTDEELNAYITENQITLLAGEEEKQKNQIRDQLKQSKLDQAIGEWFAELKAKSSINEFVKY